MFYAASITAVLFATFMEGYRPYAPFIAFGLFVFSMGSLGHVVYHREPESIKKFNDWAGDDGMMLRMHTWLGFIGVWIAASVLVGLAASC